MWTCQWVKQHNTLDDWILLDDVFHRRREAGGGHAFNHTAWQMAKAKPKSSLLRGILVKAKRNLSGNQVTLRLHNPLERRLEHSGLLTRDDQFLRLGMNQEIGMLMRRVRLNALIIKESSYQEECTRRNVSIFFFSLNGLTESVLDSSSKKKNAPLSVWLSRASNLQCYYGM